MHQLVKAVRSTSLMRETAAKLLRTSSGSAALFIVIIVVLTALFGPLIAPHDPIQQNLGDRLNGPSREYPLGTDELGRCLLSRILYGARLSVSTGLIIVGVAAPFGTALGAMAGYIGGKADSAIMRIVDIMLAFPALVLAIVIAGVMEPGLKGPIIALSLVHWTAYARLARGTVLSIKERPYVEATRALGMGNLRIVFRHVLPNAISPVIVMATFGFGHMILAAAAMNFLGLGAQPPAAEWGAMLNHGREFMRSAPQLMTWPGIAVMLTVLGFNLLGDALRDTLTPYRERKNQPIKP